MLQTYWPIALGVLVVVVLLLVFFRSEARLNQQSKDRWEAKDAEVRYRSSADGANPMSSPERDQRA